MIGAGSKFREFGEKNLLNRKSKVDLEVITGAKEGSFKQLLILRNNFPMTNIFS